MECFEDMHRHDRMPDHLHPAGELLRCLMDAETPEDALEVVTRPGWAGSAAELARRLATLDCGTGVDLLLIAVRLSDRSMKVTADRLGISPQVAHARLRRAAEALGIKHILIRKHGGS